MIKNTKELIEAWPLFSEAQRADLLQAVSTRGKHKGYLLASAPAHAKPVKWAAWSALVSELAPARVSAFGIVFQPDNFRKLFLDLEAAVNDVNFRSCLNCIEPPYRWNLWCSRVPESLQGRESEIVTDVVAKVQKAEDIRLAKVYAVEAGQKELF